MTKGLIKHAIYEPPKKRAGKHVKLSEKSLQERLRNPKARKPTLVRGRQKK